MLLSTLSAVLALPTKTSYVGSRSIPICCMLIYVFYVGTMRPRPCTVVVCGLANPGRLVADKWVLMMKWSSHDIVRSSTVVEASFSSEEVTPLAGEGETVCMASEMVGSWSKSLGGSGDNVAADVVTERLWLHAISD